MKKFIQIMIISMMTTSMLFAQGKEESNTKTEVRMLGTIKDEIGDQFEAAVEAYNESQDDYEVVIISKDGSGSVELMTTLYASGNAPNIMVMGQEFELFKDKLLDVTDSKFTKAAFPGTTNLVTIDDKVYGMPVTVEAFGLLYNKSVLDKAVGGTFNPKSINSRSSLEDLMKKTETSGVSAIHLSPMDWSLGAHVSNILFTTQSEAAAERRAFLDGLKAGTVSLMNNELFNGWLDTFDLLAEYNENSKSPLSPSYDDGTMALGMGDAGLWFMGNWAYPQLKEFGADKDYGILPFPISNDSDDYGNTQISVGVPFYLVIDGEQSTPEEQAGSISFLNWLVDDPVGQDYYVNEFNFIPVFDTFEIEPKDSMSLQILNYVSDGKSLEWMNSLYPSDGWQSMGASMQKYLTNRISREQLATELEDYWKNVD